MASAGEAPAQKAGWSTYGKAAAIAGGALIAVGAAVGSAILDDITDDDGSWQGDVDGAEAAVDWVDDAAHTAGDFIMDLF